MPGLGLEDSYISSREEECMPAISVYNVHAFDYDTVYFSHEATITRNLSMRSVSDLKLQHAT